MTNKIKRIRALGVAVLCLTTMQASAADIDGLVFTDDANFAKPAELGSGWYIRGELGFNLNGNQDVSSYGNPALATLYDNNYTDGMNYSVSAGYQLNRFLRVDAGLGRLAGSDFSSSELMTEDDGNGIRDFPTEVLPGDPNPCNGWGEFIDLATGTTYIGDDFITNCVQSDTAEYDVTFGMANVYVDLGSYYGFKPFVGAGVGIGRVSWRQELDAVICTPRADGVRVEGCRAYGTGDQPDPNEPYTQPGIVDSGVNYRLGYTVSAGVGYAVNPNVTVEALYRYMNFGGPSLSSTGTTGSMLADNGYGTHQVNLGLRYAIW
jgi:opacity protein-like surface antigen